MPFFGLGANNKRKPCSAILQVGPDGQPAVAAPAKCSRIGARLRVHTLDLANTFLFDDASVGCVSKADDPSAKRLLQGSKTLDAGISSPTFLPPGASASGWPGSARSGGRGQAASVCLCQVLRALLFGIAPAHAPADDLACRTLHFAQMLSVVVDRA